MTTTVEGSEPNGEAPQVEDQSSGSNQTSLKRILYTIGFGIIAYFGVGLLFIVSALQAVFLLITKNKNDEIGNFASNLAKYLAEVITYVAWATEEKPFPAKPFPSSNTPDDKDSTT